jgi:hypothetical protein
MKLETKLSSPLLDLQMSPSIFPVLFLVGTVFLYAFPMWIYIRKLKGRMANWSSNKAIVFIVGIGKNKTLFPNLNTSERLALKNRLAAPNEIVSDEDLAVCGKT